MTRNRALTIKNWIRGMGFQLTRSHLVDRRKKKIKYYTLGNFGVYEEITPKRNSSEKKQRFISWTPWGENFEVTNVNELSRAFENYNAFNPL